MVLLFLRHQFDAISDFAGLANQMSEARLAPFWIDGVVGRIAIGNEIATECTAEDGNGNV